MSMQSERIQIGPRVPKELVAELRQELARQYPGTDRPSFNQFVADILQQYMDGRKKEE